MWIGVQRSRADLWQSELPRSTLLVAKNMTCRVSADRLAALDYCRFERTPVRHHCRRNRTTCRSAQERLLCLQVAHRKRCHRARVVAQAAPENYQSELLFGRTRLDSSRDEPTVLAKRPLHLKALRGAGTQAKFRNPLRVSFA